MGKRDLELAAANMDVDLSGPRSKRRRDAETPTTKAESVEPAATVTKEEPSSDAEEEPVEPEDTMTPEEIKEAGEKVLNLLRDAVDKEGRQLSAAFWKLPPKKTFPDYYEIIKRPIGLDDVKSKVDRGKYEKFSDLQDEVEWCFKNAKRYNLRDSVIWKDAKLLHKMARKCLAKHVSGVEDDSDEEGKKKEKAPNLHAMARNRLKKLIDISDDQERVLSTPFMELPPRRQWASYYKLISKPICINDIFERINKREYAAVQQFIDDVNLMFDNAMLFNEENSQIWDDALILKKHFGDIMKNIPAKYLPEEMRITPEVSSNKIKLRLPGHSNAYHATQDATNGIPASSGGSMRIRVPAHPSTGSTVQNGVGETNAKSKSPETQASASVSLSSHFPQTPSAPFAASSVQDHSASPTLTAPKASGAVGSALAKFSAPTLRSQTSGQSAVPPQSFYAAPSPSQTPASVATTPATPAPNLPLAAGSVNNRGSAPSPAPPPSAAGMYSAKLETCPKGGAQGSRRKLATLTQNAGVRSFALTVPRGGSETTRLVVRGVKFAAALPEEESIHMDVDVPKEVEIVTPAKKKGRGRPKKVQPLDTDMENQFSGLETRMVRAKIQMGTWERPNSASDVLVRVDGKDVDSQARTDDQQGISEIANLLLGKQLNGDENGVAEGGEAHASVDGDGERDHAMETGEDEWAFDVSGTGRHILEIGRRENPVLWQVFLYFV